MLYVASRNLLTVMEILCHATKTLEIAGQQQLWRKFPESNIPRLGNLWLDLS